MCFAQDDTWLFNSCSARLHYRIYSNLNYFNLIIKQSRYKIFRTHNKRENHWLLGSSYLYHSSPHFAAKILESWKNTWQNIDSQKLLDPLNRLDHSEWWIYSLKNKNFNNRKIKILNLHYSTLFRKFFSCFWQTTNILSQMNNETGTIIKLSGKSLPEN